MSDVDEELMEIWMRALIREIGQSGKNGVLKLVNTVAHGIQPTAANHPVDGDPENMAEIEMTKADFDAVKRDCVLENIPLTILKQDINGGPESLMTVGIAVDDVERMTDLFQRLIGQRLNVELPETPSEAVDGANLGDTARMDQVAAEVRQALRDGHGDASIVASRDGYADIRVSDGYADIRVSAADGETLADTMTRVLSQNDIKTKGVVEVFGDSETVRRLADLARENHVAIVDMGIDRNGHSANHVEGQGMFLVDGASRNNWEYALSSGVREFEKTDPEFAAACADRLMQTDYDFKVGEIAALPCADIEISSKLFDEWTESAAAEKLDYYIPSAHEHTEPARFEETCLVKVPVSEEERLKYTMQDLENHLPAPLAKLAKTDSERAKQAITEKRQETKKPLEARLKDAERASISLEQTRKVAKDKNRDMLR